MQIMYFEDGLMLANQEARTVLCVNYPGMIRKVKSLDFQSEIASEFMYYFTYILVFN